MNADIAEHEAIDTDELREFTIAFVYFARTAPQTRRHAHGGKHAVVVKKQPLERLLDEHKILGR